ncbi:MAG: MBL fold metallo-hydrolase [Bacteroidia bacterium]|nr:MBL fold metallo-hydrolase [Bacteroidia bacterium]
MAKIFLLVISVALLTSCDFVKGFKEGVKMGKKIVENADRVVNGYGEEVETYLTRFERDTFILDQQTIDYTFTCDGEPKTKTIQPSLIVTFIKHGTLMLDIKGWDCTLIHVDPVSMFGIDYSKMPKADIVLVTHEHGDHMDTVAISAISDEETRFYSNERVAEITGVSKALKEGQIETSNTLNIIPVAAYNTTEGHMDFHPKGRDNGYVLEICRDPMAVGEKRYFRIYIAGDTEPIEEMKSLGDIDIAFIPVNQPYTMTAEQAIEAIEMIKPKVVYPYHYGETDLAPIVEHFKENGDIEVRIRQMQ